MPDPLTVAGLGLAVVPLILFAIENYEHIFEPAIIAIHGGRTEAGKFQLALDVQKARFENSCRLLLEEVTPYSNDMFRSHQHSLWSSPDINDQLEARLGDSCRACVSALQLIQQALDRALKKYGGLNVLTQPKVRFPPSVPRVSRQDVPQTPWTCLQIQMLTQGTEYSTSEMQVAAYASNHSYESALPKTIAPAPSAS
jgi:hypothetical protein